MDDEQLLATAGNPDGSQRFYPPGQHPATHRLRKHREALATLPKSAERDLSIDHIDGLLAAFEAGEDESKRDFLRVARDRERTS